MSKSFKKVVACLLAVLMVMFSVPFTAFAAPDTTVYTPDIQLQFGTLFQADGDNAAAWIDNYSEGSIENMKGKNATYDFALSGVSGPQLNATGTVSNDAKYTVTGLTLEAADTANVALTSGNDDYELSGLSADHVLQKGDAFTVTIRMDNISKLYVATAEVAYSGCIEPLYGIQEGTGKSATYTTGTAQQLGVEDEADYELGKFAVPDFDAQALYDGVNGDEIGSELRTDAVTGQKYMYAEALGADPYANVATKTKSTQCIDKDGNVTNMAGKTVLATFAFVLTENLDADHPIQFSIHNGNTKGVGSNGKYDALAEGMYKPTNENTSDSAGTTYSENRFVSASDPYGAAEENFGSRKMTFMTKNENVESAGHTHDFTGAEPAWTWADDNSSATATITCTADGCDQSEGYQISATDSEIDASEDTATCTEAGKITYSASVELNGATVSTSKDVDTEAKGHDYQAVVTQPTCTEQGYTTYTCSRCQDSYTADYTDATGHTWGNWTETTPKVDPTCTQPGTTAIETHECSVCHETENRGGDVIEAPGHDFTVPQSVDWNSLDTATGVVAVTYKCSRCDETNVDTVVAASQVIQPQTEDDAEITRYTVTIGAFSDSKDVQTKAPSGHVTHTYTVPVSLAWDGEDAVTATATYKCSKCDETTTTKEGVSVNSAEKTPATCTEAKVVTYTASCEGFESISKDVTEGQPLGHSLVKTDEVPAGCETAGTAAYWTCSTCHKMFADADAQTEIEEPASIPATGHKWGGWVETEAKVDPTKSTPGKTAVETRECANCDAYETRGGEAIDALGVDITVSKYEIGTVKYGKEQVAYEGQTFHAAYGENYTLTVEEDNDLFVGWQMNGKIVSTSKSYSTYAYADVTVDPVFTEPTTDNMTVVFYDKFGNKFAEYNGAKSEYLNWITANFPVAPNYPSLTFKGWKDITEDEIIALQESKTIYAEYEEAANIPEYTVTVRDSQQNDITADCIEGDTYKFAYDTYVTVSNEAAKAWKIGDTQVATGTSYSFYVGANTDITMVTEDTQAVPTTTIVGANRLTDPAYRYNIVATRNIPDGYELVSCGFVYGKNLVDTDMTLDNEGKVAGDTSGAVKVAYANKTASNQFALNYGIKTPGNTVCVRSFVVVKDKATGDISEVYSDIMHYES